MGRYPMRSPGPNSCLPIICVAFGLGVFLSLFVSLKLVVLLAAIFLIALGLMACG